MIHRRHKMNLRDILLAEETSIPRGEVISSGKKEVKK
jgi:hypothetical protein